MPTEEGRLDGVSLWRNPGAKHASNASKTGRVLTLAHTCLVFLARGKSMLDPDFKAPDIKPHWFSRPHIMSICLPNVGPLFLGCLV